MDLRIGVSQTAKEINVDLDDDTDADALRKDIDTAIAEGTTLWLTDRKGRQIGVPGEKLAYVEVGLSADGRRIGFGG